MQLVFDLGDESDAERYEAVREQLIGEMRDWVASSRPGADPDGHLAAAAETFLSYKVGYADGDIADVTLDDAEDYLLRWCPRKVAMAPEEGRELARGLAAYVAFMNVGGRLRGGVDRAASLIAALGDLEDATVEAMSDRSAFGIGKSLLSAPLTGDDGSPLASLVGADGLGGLDDLGIDDLQRLLDERLEAFNSLPFDERKALTDDALDMGVPRIELPFVLITPSADAVERSIGDSRLISWVRGLVEWVGSSGRPVTGTGNFKLADARHLVASLGTGDEVDPVLPWGQEKTRSSEELPMLTLTLRIGRASGAIELLKTKMKVVTEWHELTVDEQARRIVLAALDQGLLTFTGRGGGMWEDIDNLLDDGAAHFLAPVLAPDQERTIDEVTEYMRAVVVPQIEMTHGTVSDFENDLMVMRLHELFELLQTTGLVVLRYHERIDGPSRLPSWQGGSFTTTDLARVALPPLLDQIGYDLEVIDDPTTASPESIVQLVADGDLHPSQVAREWRTDQEVLVRATALCDVAASGGADDRIGAFAILGELGDPAGIEPAVRQLLDSPASAHAAVLLLDAGLATPSELGPFVTVGPFIDALSNMSDDPELLTEMFDEARAADPEVLDTLWRHDQPETAAVLEALGTHHPDKTVAKAARRAARQHRSWVQNRR